MNGTYIGDGIDEIDEIEKPYLLIYISHLRFAVDILQDKGFLNPALIEEIKQECESLPLSQNQERCEECNYCVTCEKFHNLAILAAWPMSKLSKIIGVMEIIESKDLEESSMNGTIHPT